MQFFPWKPMKSKDKLSVSHISGKTGKGQTYNSPIWKEDKDVHRIHNNSEILLDQCGKASLLRVVGISLE